MFRIGKYHFIEQFQLLSFNVKQFLRLRNWTNMKARIGFFSLFPYLPYLEYDTSGTNTMVLESGDRAHWK